MREILGKFRTYGPGFHREKKIEETQEKIHIQALCLRWGIVESRIYYLSARGKVTRCGNGYFRKDKKFRMMDKIYWEKHYDEIGD